MQQQRQSNRVRDALILAACVPAVVPVVVVIVVREIVLSLRDWSER